MASREVLLAKPGPNGGDRLTVTTLDRAGAEVSFAACRVIRVEEKLGSVVRATTTIDTREGPTVSLRAAGLVDLGRQLLAEWAE